MVRGDAEKYARLLTLFADSHEQGPALLTTALRAGDLEGIKRVAHTLKGSAGNLGATAVQEAASALHTAVAKAAGRKEIEDLLATLGAELSALIGAIRLLPQDFQSPVTATPEELAAVLDRLEGLLAIGDMAADDLVQESAPLLRAGLGAATAATLRSRIAAFDYEAALTVLRGSR
jgi:HPt (histidine-containing phosphotransfer) domain-containing protein